jgi:protease II
MKKLSYPIPKARPTKITNHNHTREDEYFWMRSDERDNPEILKHLDAENSFCASRMKSLGIDTHTRAILTEMKSYIPHLDESVPARDGEYFYFYRMFDNSDHPVYLRFPVDHPDKIETVLDVNALAATMDYCLVTEWQVSPDGQWLAYALDSDGSEVTQLIFRNLWDASCEEIHTELSADELCWAADNHHLFFTTRDPQWRSDTVWIVDVNHIHRRISGWALIVDIHRKQPDIRDVFHSHAAPIFKSPMPDSPVCRGRIRRRYRSPQPATVCALKYIFCQL